MTTTTASPVPSRSDQGAGQDPHAGGHDWRAAGAAWGHSAVDWCCLQEHYAVEVIAAMHARLGVGPGVSLLDVACGAGLGARMADGAGATVSGVDAAPALLEIARVRIPQADLRLGSMFELPWGADTFDAAVSVNGIWGDCGAALDEMHRVVKPGSLVGISFWGRGAPLDLRAVFEVYARHSPPAHVDGMRSTNNIARPGVAEEMLASAGFEVLERGSRISTMEWPDPETAWRAMRCTGPALPALEHVGEDVLRPLVMEALETRRDRFGIYRFRNDHHFVIARAR